MLEATRELDAVRRLARCRRVPGGRRARGSRPGSASGRSSPPSRPRPRAAISRASARSPARQRRPEAPERLRSYSPNPTISEPGAGVRGVDQRPGRRAAGRRPSRRSSCPPARRAGPPRRRNARSPPPPAADHGPTAVSTPGAPALRAAASSRSLSAAAPVRDRSEELGVDARGDRGGSCDRAPGPRAPPTGSRPCGENRPAPPGGIHALAGIGQESVEARASPCTRAPSRGSSRRSEAGAGQDHRAHDEVVGKRGVHPAQRVDDVADGGHVRVQVGRRARRR